jgi:uncharacterized protein
MPLLDRLQTEMVAAMKARDEARLGALRLMKSALKKQEIDGMKPLDEASEMQVLNMLIKQRREAADIFRKASREEMAQKEEAELTLIESFMPASATEDDLDNAVQAAIQETGATSAKQMGAVMKAAQAKLAGKRVDGKVLSDKVRSKLA